MKFNGRSITTAIAILFLTACAQNQPNPASQFFQGMGQGMEKMKEGLTQPQASSPVKTSSFAGLFPTAPVKIGRVWHDDP